MSGIPTILKDIEARLGGEKVFNVLYKSEGKVDVEQFHLKCDSKGPTVTVLYGKHNTIFGGYTSEDWTPSNMKLQKDGKAFLFHKTSENNCKCVFLPIKKGCEDRAITCDANFGPTFGGGPMIWNYYDLQTFKKDSKKECEVKDGYIRLNGAMNIGDVYDDSAFKGRTDVYRAMLIVKNIEVYQVVDVKTQKPWRKKPTDEEVEDIMKRLEQLETLPSPEVDLYNILLIGIVGAGKSSFFNTLATAFGGKIKTHAPARTAQKSVTNKVIKYRLNSRNGKLLKIQFVDIRGFDDERGYGSELQKILDGTISSGYAFSEKPPTENDGATMDEPEKSLNEQIHLVCLVTGTPKTDIFTSETMKNIEFIKGTVNKKGLPMVVVLTKLDVFCQTIFEDADYVYKSPKAHEAVEVLSGFYGVAKTHIFPVVNYVHDTKVNSGKNRLAIEALNCMVTVTENYLEKTHPATQKKIKDWSQRSKKLQLLKDEAEVTKLGKELTELDKKKLRVLCVGSVCSGKSSFIDSIASTLRGKLCFKASEQSATGGKSTNSDSMTEKMYQMKCKHGSGEIKASNMYIGDIPGFQETGGIRLQDVKNVIQGHVPNKYKIKNGIEKNNKKFKRQPNIEDKVHCVCFLFDISTPPDKLPVEVKERIKSLQQWLIGMEIPFVSILTKGDLMSDKVKAGKLYVFESIVIKERMDTLRDMFHFNQNYIFPVINYIHEEDVDPESDALLIAALNTIIERGKDYLENYEDDDSSESDN